MVDFIPASDTAAAESLWTALEARVDPRLACSWDWTGTWLRHFGGAVPHRFAVWPDRDAPRAMALVCEERRRKGPFTIRAVHVGTAGEPAGEGVHVEYNDVLAEPDARAPFARDLLAALEAERWDEIVLDGFAREELAAFTAADPELDLHREPAPLVPLEGGDVLDGLRSSTRQKVRRSLRGFGEVECEWAETPAAALEVLDELIELHQARWTAAGEPGAFGGERFTAFHRDLAERLVPSGRALLFRARAGDATIGCLYSFVERGRVLFYQSGLGEFEDNKLKPGLAVHALCMQACADRGLAEYNFLAGESRYKRELATAADELVWATARRQSLKLRAVALAAAARDRVKKRPRDGAPDVS